MFQVSSSEFWNLGFEKLEFMSVILPFLSGFLAAVIGIFPPGLINMTAAKVSVSDGRRRAMIFVLGALLVILVQTYISVIFARYINKNEEVVVLLREIGLGIFTVISIYFLFFAKTPKKQIDKENIQLKSKRSRFFMGMLISAINFFTKGRSNVVSSQCRPNTIASLGMDKASLKSSFVFSTEIM